MPEFQFVKKLSSGSYGTVGLVFNTEDGKYYALKTISKRHHAYKRQRVLDEVKAGQVLNHTHIARVHQHLEDDESDYIIMDFVRGYDLLNFVQTNALPEYLIQNIFIQLHQAVTYSHQHGIFHRDLKLENVMIDRDMKITVIDFGLCHINQSSHAEDVSTDFCGTIEYAAPELILHHPYLASKADVWCMGVMLYAMLFGRYPFLNDQRRQIKGYEDHPPLIFPLNKGSEFSGEVSDAVKNLMERLLTVDPKSRISMAEIAQHPWVCSQLKSVGATC